MALLWHFRRNVLPALQIRQIFYCRLYTCINKEAILFLEIFSCTFEFVPGRGLLTPHGRALLFITHEPDVLLRELAQRLSITERHAHGILNDLVEDGFLTKTKEGRRNRYEIQADIPVPEVTSRELPVGSFLEFLAGA
jgi:hypothetical protein